MGFERPFEGCKSPIVDFSMYDFKVLNVDYITPEEYFVHAYIEEVLKAVNTTTFT